MLGALINSIQQWSIFSMRGRTRLARLMGHRLSDQTFIAERVHLGGSGLVTEGVVFINRGTLIDAIAPIHIADGVSIASEVMLQTATHKFGGPDRRAGEVAYRPIDIGRGTWIGARAIILPGVTIAPGCIIAAGAVVATDTMPNGLYAGVPAQRIKNVAGPG